MIDCEREGASSPEALADGGKDQVAVSIAAPELGGDEELGARADEAGLQGLGDSFPESFLG